MLNAYPERASDPSNLLDYDADRSKANCAAIEQVLGRYGVTEVLVA